MSGVPLDLFHPCKLLREQFGVTGKKEKPRVRLERRRRHPRIHRAPLHPNRPPHPHSRDWLAQSGPSWVGSSRVGSEKWALSHWIMPLFQLLWSGMPNFTARYSSPRVNQSRARGRGARGVRLFRHRVTRSIHWSLRKYSVHPHSSCSNYAGKGKGVGVAFGLYRSGVWSGSII